MRFGSWWNRDVDASPPPAVAPHRLTLSRLERGAAGRILAVPPAEAVRLAADGLEVGATFVLEARLPLGGPVVVRLGRARVALARQLAGEVVVELAGADSVEAGA